MQYIKREDILFEKNSFWGVIDGHNMREFGLDKVTGIETEIEIILKKETLTYKRIKFATKL